MRLEYIYIYYATLTPKTTPIQANMAYMEWMGSCSIQF